MDASDTIINEIEKALKQLIFICNKYSLSGIFSTLKSCGDVARRVMCIIIQGNEGKIGSFESQLRL